MDDVGSHQNLNRDRGMGLGVYNDDEEGFVWTVQGIWVVDLEKRETWSVMRSTHEEVVPYNL